MGITATQDQPIPPPTEPPVIPAHMARLVQTIQQESSTWSDADKVSLLLQHVILVDTATSTKATTTTNPSTSHGDMSEAVAAILTRPLPPEMQTWSSIGRMTCAAIERLQAQHDRSLVLHVSQLLMEHQKGTDDRLASLKTHYQSIITGMEKEAVRLVERKTMYKKRKQAKERRLEVARQRLKKDAESRQLAAENLKRAEDNLRLANEAFARAEPDGGQEEEDESEPQSEDDEED